ncbi:alpha/beta fold hydrolase [Streptomyces sp. NPDC091265]|uniref:S9 family peptidase n=1 Tax=unclassified Streptomyces TaxID=2593676 RepID=UPI00344CB50D
MPVRVDMATGGVSRLFDVERSTPTHLLLAAPEADAVLVAEQDGAHTHLSMISGGRARRLPPLTLPESLAHAARIPLALSPDGTHLALTADRGTGSHLLITAVTGTGTEALSEPDCPSGVLTSAARWVGDSLRLVGSTPTEPFAPLSLAVSTRIADGAKPPPRRAHAHWEVAHTEVLAGAAGALEAVVYGGKDWARAPQLVVALHGGPAASWKLEFNPFFQRLAAAGIAVLAPNQRGSTGYGPDHRAGIRGAWGGPDLDDILHIVRSLTGQRRGLPPAMLYGESYGAYLALLAAGHAPAYWSRCALISPFLSARSLHDVATPAVRSFLERQGAGPARRGARTSRAAEECLHEITAQMVICHGLQDEVVPVNQSQELRSRLLALGWREDLDFALREVRGGHNVLSGSNGHQLQEDLVSFFVAGLEPPTGAVSKEPEEEN